MDPELKAALDALGTTQAKAIEAQQKATDELRAAHEADIKKRDALYDDRIAKLQAELDKFEPLNKVLLDAEKRAEKAELDRKEQQEQLDRIEASMNRPGTGDHDDPKATAQRAAFFDHARFGLERMQQERKNVLTVSDDTGGGYLAPSEYVMEILKAEIEYSPFRSVVRTRTTSAKSVQLPKRTGVFAARWTGEIEQRSETVGLAYGLEDVPVHELTAEVYVSAANLEDSAFDIEAELTAEFGEQFGVAEGMAMVSGAGTKKPEGMLIAVGTVGTKSGDATNITADGIINLKYGIKTAYARRGLFAMNRTSLAAVRKLKDLQNNYIWQPGLAQGRPNSIDGDPYIEAPDMPDIAAGSKPILFGDLMRAYTLVDRISMAVVRDGLTRASFGQVKFVARRRVGGQVVLPEAIGVMTVSA